MPAMVGVGGVLLVLLGGCGDETMEAAEPMVTTPAPQIAAPSDADLGTVRDAALRAIEENDGHAWTMLYDSGTTVSLAATDRPLPAALVAQSRAEAERGEAAILGAHHAMLADGGSVRHVRNYEADGGRWVGLGVVYGTGTFDQIGLRVAATPDGPRVVDVWGLNAGISASAQLRARMLALTEGGPADVRAEQVARIQQTATLGHADPSYLAALQTFVDAYPDDSAALVHRLELASVAGDHQDAADVAEALHERFGPDAYLLVIAASARARAGDLAGAQTLAARAVAQEPTLLAAQMQQLTVAASAGDNQVIAETLRMLSDNYSVTPAVFPESEAWARLRASAAYKAWAAE